MRLMLEFVILSAFVAVVCLGAQIAGTVVVIERLGQ